MPDTPDGQIATAPDSTRNSARVVPAFPGSLRDYFAGQALAGWGEEHHAMMQNHFGPNAADYAKAGEMVRVCYLLADSMLAARSLAEQEE